ncbi:cobaltochelatase subunit CobN [Pleomorphomonas carboxyditropha]|uniref:Cobaltochelatase subunit CobN n=1 Tax=Pleomorphomonas carboxyditropha TaxID=2023338 RepID=A0A2G9WW68_9HYPH|nr:cobaltochelatase subunit CobN [Pleomorphomonas carboxyditropha]PIO98965.1 cobaltochelatase subunit CobN [Pleomorphomonas carboxyditropha]
MHILAEQIRSLDDSVAAVDLGQTPAEIVVLSFSDSDLGLIAAMHGRLGPEAPSLRLASLAALRHPYSVDLYLEKVLSKARFVLVRLLGGADYWRYGVDELSMLARSKGIDLALIPGDDSPDPRLAAASTLPAHDLDLLTRWFGFGGPDNVASALAFVAARLGRATAWAEPAPQPAFGAFPRVGGNGDRRVLVVGYRALVNAGDAAPIDAVTEALAASGFAALPVWVTSLKDPEVAGPLGEAIAAFQPDAIVNCTAFSARRDDGTTLLDAADVPVIQAPLSTLSREVWVASSRGLSATDLAMSVVLPEVDGRLDGPVVSFKAPADRAEALEYTPIRHRPDAEGIARLVRLVDGWIRLRKTPRPERRIGLVLSNYSGKGGRTAYAVGLDGPASLTAIADDLRVAGYDIGPLPDEKALIAALEGGEATIDIPIADYRRWFAELPEALRASMTAAWGAPEADPLVKEGAFRLAAIVAGNLVVAVQPDRGRSDARVADHHDPNLPPRHAYAAFYLWLRHGFAAQAMIHLGTHGTLEWLPGKAAGLSGDCAPAALTDGLPVVYPFIVNNPGEAAQAKRRIAAVTLGHLTPPLTRAGAHGDIADIEMLVDEFANAQALDPRRAKHLAAVLTDKAEAAGIAEAAGLSADLDPADKLARLDAWICDVKDMRIADGLHVFGRAPDETRVAAHLDALGGDLSAAGAFLASARAEREGLLSALDGRRVAPGPSGAPGPRRLDVLPTGRNLYAIDPRAVPTRTAMEIGARTAEEVVARYVEDHGDWPKSIVLDVWASASMRTGGDDIAQALALMGVRPTWDAASGRVSGFTVLAPARLGRPRVDVTLRVSGLFRDVFPGQIALFDQAVKAVAALDEDVDTNPLAACRDAAPSRIYGAAPGAFGSGLGEMTPDDLAADRSALADAYLAASGHAYAGEADAADPSGFAARVAAADAFVHVQDLDGQDLLSNDAFPAHEGGFAAAAGTLGGRAALYHVDATGDAPKVRTLDEEIGRVVHGRATNPRWIAGQMRHGHRGAAEICEAVANLCAFATLSDAVDFRHFDRLFDATFGDDRVRDFLIDANPAAARDTLLRLRKVIDRGAWALRRNSVAARLADTEARLK